MKAMGLMELHQLWVLSEVPVPSLSYEHQDSGVDGRIEQLLENGRAGGSPDETRHSVSVGDR